MGLGENRMAKTTTQSIEPVIADLANGWMKTYGLDYKLEQETLNTEIDTALTSIIQRAAVMAETDRMPSCYCGIKA